MTSSGIGPLTTYFEALAAVVGAGMVLGGFTIGVCRLMTGSSRQALQLQALTDGYFGGLVGAGLTLLDLALRYI